MGQPVILRHMYGLEDVAAGVAKQCPACFDPAYNQTRSDCVVCYGQGFVSVADNPDGLFIDQNGQIQSTSGPGWVPAPQYGGFSVPFLTWMVEPDIAVDVFRINDQGVMVQQYDAQGMAPWFPTVGDNDLCINVTLANDGFTILETLDRFQLKRVEQITVRGFGKRSTPGSNGQPHLVAQSFQMNKVPSTNKLYAVPTDEPWY